MTDRRIPGTGLLENIGGARRIAAALGEAGFAAEPDEILTAPVATAAYLRANHPAARCFVLSSGDIQPQFNVRIRPTYKAGGFMLEVNEFGEIESSYEEF